MDPMQRFVTFLFVILLLGASGGGCGGDELANFVIITFIDAPGGNCKLLAPGEAYGIQIQFVDISGQPAPDHPDSFNITAWGDNRDLIGYFEGPTPTRNPNPYDMTPTGTIFTIVYFVPEDITVTTNVNFETLPTPIFQPAQGFCTIEP